MKSEANTNTKYIALSELNLKRVIREKIEFELLQQMGRVIAENGWSEIRHT